MQRIKTEFNISYNRICQGIPVGYSSVMRWAKRAVNNQKLIGTPGPRKTQNIDLENIRKELGRIKIWQKRTPGMGILREKYAERISRRELLHLVKAVRYEQQHRMKRIEWHTPGLAWALDGAQCDAGEYQQARDLASQYKFSPLMETCGEGIAGYLAGIFSQYGAPLFLKRDNGGNLNHGAVNEVLAEYHVIPLNSPNYYPPYNGAIEHDQGELKQALYEELCCSAEQPGVHLPAYLKIAVGELNHKPRRSLGNLNSCRVFFDRKEECKYTIRERNVILEWLRERAGCIIKNMKYQGAQSPSTAWRVAVEHWLRIHGHITVRINGKVLPDLSPIFSH